MDVTSILIKQIYTFNKRFCKGHEMISKHVVLYLSTTKVVWKS